MTLYNEFKNKWKELNDSELDKRINIFLLWKIMRNKDTNKFAIQTVLKKLQNPNNSIFDELKEFMELNDNSMLLQDKFSPKDTKITIYLSLQKLSITSIHNFFIQLILTHFL